MTTQEANQNPTPMSASAAQFDPVEAARAQLQTAYQERMAEVMAGLVQADSSRAHLEWLAEAELCLEQFERVSDWLQTQVPATASPAAAQSSAA